MRDRLLGVLSVLILVGAVSFTVVTSMPDPEEVLKRVAYQTSVIEQRGLRVVVKEAHSPHDIVEVECDKVKPVTYSRVPSLEGLPVEERRRRFVDLLLPSVLVANREVDLIRSNVLKIKRKIAIDLPLSPEEVDYLELVKRRCGAGSVDEILAKVKPVRPSLLIAQAALESGWEASNLMEGQPTILDVLRSYVCSADTNPVKGSDHGEKVRRVVEENGLARLDRCTLDPSYLR